MAIPNGSLYEATMRLLGKAGMRVEFCGRRFDGRLVGSRIFDRVIVMRPQDMPEALLDGMVDAAIYGLDWHEESGLADQLCIITELGYSKKTMRPVRVVVFGKRADLLDDESIIVTTEYLLLAKRIFKKAKLRFSHGGTEQKVAYGKYDYGVCVAETGDSLRANGLHILKTILVSPTILAARKPEPELLLFGELLVGALRSDGLRLLKLNADQAVADDVLARLPALRSPTMNRLSDGAYAIETVVKREEVADLVVGLKQLGASGILVQPIDLVC